MCNQIVYCQACGKQFATDFRNWDGRVCCKDCWRELEYKRALLTSSKTHEQDKSDVQR